VIGKIYRKYGYVKEDVDTLSGRDLGLAVAKGMIAFSKFVGFPTCLRDVEGVTTEHVTRCLTAAKNPQLDMKLKNMPVALNADLVEAYMRPILEAAWSGDIETVKNM
jgi:hypothetical protein